MHHTGRSIETAAQEQKELIATLHIPASLKGHVFIYLALEALGELFVMNTLKNGVWFLGYFGF